MPPAVATDRAMEFDARPRAMVQTADELTVLSAVGMRQVMLAMLPSPWYRGATRVENGIRQAS
jgi:hypothetical protein